MEPRGFRGISEGPLPAPLGMVKQREVRKQARVGGGRWGDRAAEAGRGLVRPRRKAASRRREVAISSRRGPWGHCWEPLGQWCW